MSTTSLGPWTLTRTLWVRKDSRGNNCCLVWTKPLQDGRIQWTAMLSTQARVDRATDIDAAKLAADAAFADIEGGS